MQGCHPSVEQMKADYLEYLYQTSGRANPAHPMHSLYTGLWQEHQRECAWQAMRAWWEIQSTDPEAFDR